MSRLQRLQRIERVALAAREVADPMLAKINALPGVLEPLTAADVFVFNMDGFNDAVFSDGRRRIRTGAVHELISLAPGVPVMVDHAPDGGMGGGRDHLPVGRIFDSRARIENGTTWGNLDAYMLRNVFDGGEYAKAILGGLVTESSLGAFFGKQECSICGGSIWDCDHALGATYDGKTALLEYDDCKKYDEHSFVYRGAVKGTRFYRLAAGDTLEAEDAEAALKAIADRTPPKPPTFWERCAAAKAKRQEELRGWFSGRKPVNGGGSPGE